MSESRRKTVTEHRRPPPAPAQAHTRAQAEGRWRCPARASARQASRAAWLEADAIHAHRRHAVRAWLDQTVQACLRRGPHGAPAGGPRCKGRTRFPASSGAGSGPAAGRGARWDHGGHGRSPRGRRAVHVRCRGAVPWRARPRGAASRARPTSGMERAPAPASRARPVHRLPATRATDWHRLAQTGTDRGVAAFATLAAGTLLHPSSTARAGRSGTWPSATAWCPGWRRGSPRNHKAVCGLAKAQQTVRRCAGTGPTSTTRRRARVRPSATSTTSATRMCRSASGGPQAGADPRARHAQLRGGRGSVPRAPELHSGACWEVGGCG
jgi:hypothetical protein